MSAFEFRSSNATQHRRAQAADADAKQTASGRCPQSVSEETLRLQRAVTQMQAAREGCLLDYYQIAQKNVEAVETRMNSFRRKSPRSR